LDNVQIVQGVYEAFGRGDIPAVLGAMDPAIEWRPAEGHPYMPSGEPWIGPDAVLSQVFMRIGSDWDGFKVHPQVFHDAGDAVIVEARYTGTGQATGKSAGSGIQACHIWRLRDRRIVSFQQYVDTARLQDVMGYRATT
jgi:ketosteroid isomerase-like protein